MYPSCFYAISADLTQVLFASLQDPRAKGTEVLNLKESHAPLRHMFSKCAKDLNIGSRLNCSY